MNLIKHTAKLPTFAFVGKGQKTLIASAFLVLTSAVLFIVMGLNLGVDFRGGLTIHLRTDGPADLAEIRTKVNTLNLGEVGVKTFDRPDDVLITAPLKNLEADGLSEEEVQQQAVAQVKSVLTNVLEYLSVESVSPNISKELINAGIWATLFALLAIAVYIWVRFEWHFALAALIALAHDILTTIGLFALTGFEFNLATVAAILTIAGYSINDTVVVFDRVREELKRYKKKPVEEVLDIALNATLSRTMMTSMTTLLALLALVIFGGPVIRGFSVALIWGVLIGTYSSLFVATPLLLRFNLRPGAFEKKAEAEDGAAAYAAKLHGKEMGKGEK